MEHTHQLPCYAATFPPAIHGWAVPGQERCVGTLLAEPTRWLEKVLSLPRPSVLASFAPQLADSEFQSSGRSDRLPLPEVAAGLIDLVLPKRDPELTAAEPARFVPAPSCRTPLPNGSPSLRPQPLTTVALARS